MSVSDLASPCFLVDIDRVKQNVGRMWDTCNKLGLQLRVHTKTHRTLELAELQTKGTKRCIVVSTLADAEFYADHGFEDILLGYPITEDKIKRCLKLREGLDKFHVMISDHAGLECLENSVKDLPHGKTWSVELEVDTGYGRTGYPWDGEGILEAALKVKQATHMVLEKLYSHCGNLYDAKSQTEAEKMQDVNIDRLLATQARLIDHGVPCTSGIGSTPTCSRPIQRNAEVTEFHPGSYVFYDYEMLLLGVCKESDIACRVMTRVIAHKPELHLILVDCGFTALGHDGMKQLMPGDFCIIQGQPNLRLTGMSQEIGKIVAKEGNLDVSKYPVGTMLYIFPFHSCATAAMHSKFYVHSGDKVTGTLTPIRGW